MTKRNTNVKTPPLTIVIDDARWKSERGLMPKLAKAAHVALGGLPEKIRPLAKRAQFTLLLTSDKTVKELNHDFRGINKPTNVLSFPQFTRAQVGRFGKGKGPVYVGDIAIAYRYTVDEARKDNKILSGHDTHLLIHGH
jgi:probable rRNA maturation factor